MNRICICLIEVVYKKMYFLKRIEYNLNVYFDCKLRIFMY